MRSTKLMATAAVIAAGALLGYATLDTVQARTATAAAAKASALRVDNFRLSDQNLLATELYRMADA